MYVRIPERVTTENACLAMREVGLDRIVVNQEGRFIDMPEQTQFCLVRELADRLDCDLRLGRDGRTLSLKPKARGLAQVIPFPAAVNQSTPPGAA